ncbi:hypothetical protein WMF45_12865 [Sorangium sp. So ce448]|uniref:hypothetical protein n=1 Tax=Sorangium sp. So ce448 TaxID=3133314 RepID=UPI003F60EEBC
MGVKLRVAHRSSDKAERAKTAGHDAVILDFAKPETLRPALDGVDAVFLLGSGGAGQIEDVAASDEAAKAGMVAGGIPELYADAMIDLNRLYRSGAGAGVTSAVKDVTGREPIGFERFAQDHAAALR